jgi:hypothetical protein
MFRLIAIAAFALAVATSAQAMSPVPLHQSDGMVTQVREACGAGRVRIHGVCVARTTKRQVRRSVRRCAVWGAGHVCRHWVY